MRKKFEFSKDSILKRIKITVIAAAVILILLLTVKCPIRFLTGISCPVCGMTRACVSALKLNFKLAFSYHPLWVTVPFVFLYFYFAELLPKKLSKFILYGFITLFLSVYFWRLFLLNDPVIVPDLSEGIAAKIVTAILDSVG